MRFNNNGSFPPGKKGVILRCLAVCLSLVVAVSVWFWLVPYARKLAVQITINELVACLTLLITICTIVFKLTDSIIKKTYTAKRKISLDVQVLNNHAIISCRIENCGTKRLVPQNIYLIVENGVYNSEEHYYEFPYILKHEKGEDYCAFSKLCQRNTVQSVPPELIEDRFKKLFRQVVKLKHLSSETILYVDPDEEFSEDMVFKLDNGCYKATVVWTSVKEECICTTKEFIIGG